MFQSYWQPAGKFVTGVSETGNPLTNSSEELWQYLQMLIIFRKIASILLTLSSNWQRVLDNLSSDFQKGFPN
jgi:hypothetical protein